MLAQLHIKNFTAFREADFKFSTGLNVIIGANGAGKSHALKLAYSVARTSFGQKGNITQSKAIWQSELAFDLVRVFRPESLGRLARRQQGHTKAEVSVQFRRRKEASISFTFSTKSTSDVQIADLPTKFAPGAPIFIPTKELLSLFPGLRGLYQEYELAIDETYPDLCDRLDRPLVRGPRLEQTANLLAPLEEMADGEIKNENGRFYLYQKNGAKLEIDLVAEGIRKVATLAYLLKNGSLSDATTLFWDEPEANLNPALIKSLAVVLMLLASRSYQIIIATHSLFLLKELHILSKDAQYENASIRYFGLDINQNERATTVVSVDDLEQLPHITSLQAELEQTDRFSDALNAES